MINCITCIHYELVYEIEPKRIFDGCRKYDLYLKSNNKCIVPCDNCIKDNYKYYKDVKPKTIVLSNNIY